MFEPFLVDFFVNSTDAAFIRRLKLDILTCIATESNIGLILDELHVRSSCLSLFLHSLLPVLIATTTRRTFTRKIRNWSPHRSKRLAAAHRACRKLPTGACAP